MSVDLFEYKGARYPDYLRNGNAMQFIAPVAEKFCVGRGLDVGAGSWPFGNSVPVELKNGGDALNLPRRSPEFGGWDYIFSSHCLEHLDDPVDALSHWASRLRSGGVLFLYLPHPDMEYWRPQNCRKHKHLFWPRDVAKMLTDLGFSNVIHSERDMAWSFCVVGTVA